ncbi:MAG: PilZ domain-containing protein [Selenomonadaceae bacterium]|nr:PilZ domain-containing protein [Selenomonadaceae bacterium]
MILQDLQLGQEITLEVCFDEHKYEIPSKIVGTNENTAIILPYVYKGIMIDFEIFKQRGAFINMYCIDRTNNTRNVFKNVTVSTISYQERTLYSVNVPVMNTIAYDGERRKDVRIPVDVKGTMESEDNLDKYPVTICDISERGLAFTAPATYSFGNGLYWIHVFDTVCGTYFDLKMGVSIIRSTDEEHKKFYGCRIIKSDRDILMYLYLLNRQHKEKELKLKQKVMTANGTGK